MEEEDICRVCRSEGSSDNPLFYPCVCTGSIRYIHQECLMKWLQHSRTTKCELCHHPFSFSPIYADNMPSRIPLTVLLHGAWSTTINTFVKFFRLFAVFLCWFVIMPYSITRIWKFIFPVSEEPSHLVLAFLIDILLGCALSVIIVVLFFGFMTLRDFLIANNVNIEEEMAGNAGHENWMPEQEPEIIENQHPPNQLNNEQQVDAQNQEFNFGLEAIFDGPPNDLTFEEWVGIQGPFMRLVEKLAFLLFFKTIAILCFAALPYYLGRSLLNVFYPSEFHAAVCTPVGYIFMCFCAGLSIVIASYIHPSSNQFFVLFRKVFLLFYVFFRVVFLVICELCIFPMLCGWWLDICTLDLQNSSFQSRREFFYIAPLTSSFLHWLVGILYMFHFASFISLCREVLRPGVLWFLRDANDPNFNPLKEMVEQPLYWHARRVLMSAVMYGTILLLTVWVPVEICAFLFPSILPLNLLFSHPVFEVPVDLLIFHILFPSIVERFDPKTHFKSAIRRWLDVIGDCLQLKDYLLGPPSSSTSSPEEPINVALLKPKTHFIKRIFLLFILLGLSFIAINTFSFSIPILIGRFFFGIFSPKNIHEMYTFGLGIYLLVGSFLLSRWGWQSWLNSNWRQLITSLLQVVVYRSKFLLSFLVLIGIIPLMMGLLFDLAIVMPLKVPTDETVVFFMLQDWAVGLVCMKIAHKLVLLGPDSFFKSLLLRINSNDQQGIDFYFLLWDVAFPVVNILGLILSTPFVLIRGISPLLGVSHHVNEFLFRYSYLLLSLLYVVFYIKTIIWRVVVAFHNRIRDDKYLIGRQLVNYDAVSQSH